MAQRIKRNKVTFSDAFLLLLIGIGIGWLIGLSVSPVLHIIVASVIAVAAGMVGTLAGVDRESSVTKDEPEALNQNNPAKIPKYLVRINPLPLTALVSGLVVGSCIGIYARTNDYLGPSPHVFTQKWSGMGLEEKDIKLRLFDQLYPPAELQGASSEAAKKSPETVKVELIPGIASGVTTGEDSKPPKPPASASAKEHRQRPQQLAANLYAITAEDCGLIRLKQGAELRTALRALGNGQIAASIDKCNDDNCLEAIKELICSGKK